MNSIEVSQIDKKLFDYVTLDFCKELGVCPMHEKNNILFFATCDSPNLETLQRLEWVSGKQVYLKKYDKSWILDNLNRSEQSLDRLSGASQEFKMEIMVGEGDDESYQDVSRVGDEATGPVVDFINTLILTALKKRASDIHVEAHENNVIVKYRLDGYLVSATEALDKAHQNAFISRLKVMSELDIAEKRVPQDGRFKLRVNGKDVDFRISVLPGIHGESIVIRVLDNSVSFSSSILSLEALGMSDQQYNALKKVINEPYGMVLVTGPTGSGKTTTLYAALNSINDGNNKIITIEDPVEYQLSGVLQIPINEKKGMSFASGLRSILRHDPDKILVGEIRDSETANIAIQSALTGHLVFSSVHANNAIDVLARLQNMDVDLSNCIAALNAVIAQRLVRILCTHCKKPNTKNKSSAKGEDVYVSTGCSKCDYTGFKGRKMVSEFLLITDNVKKKMIEQKHNRSFLENLEYVGGENLRESALKQVLAGHTTMEEIDRVTFA